MSLRPKGWARKFGASLPAGRGAVAAGFVCAAVVAAAILLLEAHDHALPPTDPGLVRSWYRSVMCVGLGVALAVWAPWVRRRCSDVYIARNLGWAAGLLAAWLVLVLVKYETENPLVASLMWYLYYVPMLAVPTLGLFSLVRAAAWDGRSGVRAARRVVVAVDVALVLLVLTNNAHHLAFMFTFDDPAWSASYRYGPGYWAVMGWVAAQLAAFLALAYFAASRRLRPLLALVAVVVGVGLVYGVLYVLGAQVARSTNLALIYSVLALAAFETCLDVGIFPSYRAWAYAFSRLPLDLKVVDRAGRVAFATRCAVPLDEAVRAEAMRLGTRPDDTRAPFRVPGHAHRRYGAYRLVGGTALLTEDVTYLDERREQLEARRAELQDYNALLERNLGVRSRLLSQQAERELAQEVERALASALGRAAVLLDELAGADLQAAGADEGRGAVTAVAGDAQGEPEGRRARLAELRLLLAYCKRKAALVLLEREGGACDAASVGLVVRELSCELRAVGAVCTAVAELDAPVSWGTASSLTDCLYACALATVGCAAPVALLVVREVAGGSVELRALIEAGERAGGEGAAGVAATPGPRGCSTAPGGCAAFDPVALEGVLAARAGDAAVEGDARALCARVCIARGSS